MGVSCGIDRYGLILQPVLKIHQIAVIAIAMKARVIERLTKIETSDAS
ncbi:hypothetical protein FP2506_01445 [Fulvimarina pelagi HTCC2506]|uniref:Uncharacterized protein n=1 Tax=Fulvimarina pelagi HTCC2506 TaxID=314231 RepID=Q0G208_9HYPH|nr:hypothetical protein FP2506_01445 [Fulvimarina pelagi HTCC2506]